MCIWIDKWFVCSQHMKVGLAAKPRPIVNQENPWLSWRHGDEVSLEDCAKWNLTPPDGWQLIRHKQSFIFRCANLRQAPCMKGPRETHTELYKVSCPSCSGDDSHTMTEQPYCTEISGHYALTVEERRELTRTADSYWDHHLRYESALLNTLVPEIPHLADPNIGLNGELAKFFELYGPGLCTEVANHVTERFNCHSCQNLVHPEAHNSVRAMRLHEAQVLFAQDPVQYQMHLRRLSDQNEALENLRQDRSPDLPQAWYSKGHLGNQAKLSTWPVIIEEYLMELVKRGPEVEDADSRRTELVGDWDQIVAFRAWYAQQIARVVLQDTGLSDLVLEELFRRHILPILAPWPFEPMARTRFEDITGATPLTQEFVKSLDSVATRDVIPHQIRIAKDRQLVLMQAIDFTRAKIMSNTTRIDKVIEIFARQHIIDRDIALTIEDACACCGDQWTPGHHVTFAQQIVQMPCCRKPLHVRCIKSHLRNEVVLRQKEDYRCPMCRGDVKAHGWFDGQWMRSFHQTETLPIGFLYLDTGMLVRRFLTHGRIVFMPFPAPPRAPAIANVDADLPEIHEINIEDAANPPDIQEINLDDEDDEEDTDENVD